MENEKFCLRWNEFESNISKAFKELRDNKELFDVTLACDDEQIQAHKVILSACSPFFRNIFLRNSHHHFLLYMKGVRFTDLQAVLNFMYQGEVSVAQEELNSFLAVAEDLKVKGLTQSKTGSHQETNSTRSSNYKHMRSPSPPQYKHRTKVSDKFPAAPIKHATASNNDYITDTVPIKSEPRDPAPVLPSHHHQDYHDVDQHQPVAQYTGEVATYQEEDGYDEAGYEDYGDYQEQGYTEQVNIRQEATNKQTRKGNEPDRKVLYEYTKKENINGKTVSVCTLCGKSNINLGNIVNHVESVHFPDMFTYTCKYCGKTFNAKNNLNVHIYKFHSMEKSNY